MSSIQYMRPAGVWLCSCQEGTPPPDGAIPAPADADGFHGSEGLQWDGKGWVAYVSTDDVRRAMAADRWQLIAALDMISPAIWAGIEAYANDPECDPISRAAIRAAVSIPRVSETVDLLAYILGWDNDQVDGLFRTAMAIRG